MGVTLAEFDRVAAPIRRCQLGAAAAAAVSAPIALGLWQLVDSKIVGLVALAVLIGGLVSLALLRNRRAELDATFRSGVVRDVADRTGITIPDRSVPLHTYATVFTGHDIRGEVVGEVRWFDRSSPLWVVSATQWTFVTPVRLTEETA